MTGLRRDWPRLQSWGNQLADVFAGGGRLLAAGNGGSAAEAQHLTAELVGRFLQERRRLSAICLSAETSSLTAIVNDYGAEEMFARQVEAHGRPGDVLLLLSTSGRSPNVLHAADRARKAGIVTWAMTGPGPNPLSTRCDDADPGPRAVHRRHPGCPSDRRARTVRGGRCRRLGSPERGHGVPRDGPEPAGTRQLRNGRRAPDRGTGLGAHRMTARTPRRTGRPHVVVVGDVVLDRDLVGTAERLAPDAPVPVLDVSSPRETPGRRRPCRSPRGRLRQRGSRWSRRSRTMPAAHACGRCSSRTSS